MPDGSTGSLLYSVKPVYAASAQAAGRGLTRIGVLGAQPPPVDQRWRHWAYSLTRVHDSMAIARLVVPGWTYAAITHVDAWLRARDEARVSTSMAPGRARCG